MLGEFYYDDSTRSIAVLFFAAGLLNVLYYYLIEVPQQWRKDQKKP
jgi:hypothetical protein